MFSGKRGIRTPGASQLNGFQDRRNRPLCHLSERKNITEISFFQLEARFYFPIRKRVGALGGIFGEARWSPMRFAGHVQTTMHGARTDGIALRIQINKYFTVLFLKQAGIFFDAVTFTRVDIFDG